ncbi:MAG: glutamate synthase-related protein, partial [Alphaproteobacteria bacterium]|nr:glutamate synthase-related protein [Alphaproteobacteria bacterium]
VAKAVANSGCAWMGHVKPDDAMPWLQQLKPGETPDPAAAAAIYEIGDSFKPFEVKKANATQLVGLSVQGPALAEAIPFALENNLELMVLDGTHGSELAGPPDMTVLRDAIRILRGLNQEEEIDLVWYGGVRSGTDVAKALALGSVAAAVGVAMAIAAGGTVTNGAIAYAGDRTIDERVTGAEYLIQSMASETSIMARCTGKTNVHNLEPEDLKCITIAASEATGIPLAGTR